MRPQIIYHEAADNVPCPDGAANGAAMIQEVPEAFAKAEILSDGSRYHYGIDDAVYHFHEMECLEPDEYPIALELCKEHYGLVHAAADVAKRIHEDPSFGALQVEDAFLENLYWDCDDWADDLIDQGCIAVKDLDWAISIFKSLNHWIYLFFGESKRFKPDRDVIGLHFLAWALKRFDLAQRIRHSVWYPAQPAIKWDLTWEFVEEYTKDF